MNTDELTLTFSVNRIVLAERALGKTIADIVKELEGGEPSLTTMRALVAAGTVDGRYLHLPGVKEPPLDLGRAGRLIEQHGTKAISLLMGKAMNHFLATLVK